MLEIIKNHIFHLDEIILMLQYKFTKQSRGKWWLTDSRFNADIRDDITFCYDILKDVSRSFAEVICKLPNNISLDFIAGGFIMLVPALFNLCGKQTRLPSKNLRSVP